MNKYSKLFKNILNHELVSGSFYIFLGTTVSSFLAFLLNVFLARDLSYSDYGIYSSLLSIITLLTIPSSAILAVIVRYATIFFSKGEDDRAGAFYIKSSKYLFLLGFFLNIFFLISFPAISNFLKIDQIGLIILSGISVALFYMATLNIGFLQSLLKFRLVGFLYSIAGIAKLVVGIILVNFGYRVYGALLATLAFSLIDYLISIFPLKSVISKAGKEINIGVKDFTSYAIPTSVAIFFLSSFVSFDVLLVKHFFNATEAGFYGGLSLVGKVIFYFTGPIPVAMFPLIVKKHANNERYSHLFHLALILVLIPSLLITAFYFIFPEFTIKLFLGGRGYLAVAPYLGIFGIFMTLFSINNVFINYFLSIKKTIVSIIVVFWALSQIILICIYHKDFYQVIFVSILTSVLLLISLVLYYLKDNGIYKFRK